MRIAIENNYRPNMLARGMRGQRTNLIGIVVGDISRPFFTEYLQGAEEEARKESFAIIIGNANESPDTERQTIETFLSYHCAGIVICPVSDNLEVLKELQDAKANFVVFDRLFREESGFSQVAIKNSEAAFMAVERLIESGHHRIAYIVSDMHESTVTDRYLGFTQALRAHSLKADLNLVKECHSAADAARQTRQILSPDQQATAIFIADEAIALSVISTIIESGLKVPQDISVVIFGNPHWAAVFPPGFTCVKRPAAEMGRISVTMLIRQIRNQARGEHEIVELSSELIDRGSIRMM
jgi:DNA-binding LacI/PurR family transcriptional regulator